MSNKLFVCFGSALPKRFFNDNHKACKYVHATLNAKSKKRLCKAVRRQYTKIRKKEITQS